ncbi:MAG: hypothetical protein IJC65_02260 [Oscillospiraceae bacterium]|nr:hypothetical protein [Oscillospiraceae bacterium]
MEENSKFDFDTIMDELSTRLEEIIECTLVDQLDSAVTCAVQNAFPEALSENFSDSEFVLADGTIVRPRQRMKLLSPDKSKLVICYGGLRVDDSALMVQTRISCWENIACYQSREEAIEALIKVKNAMEANLSIFEL